AGGPPPYIWSTSGSGPAGLAIDPASGVLAGAPQAPGNFSLHILVQDAVGDLADRVFSLHIGAPGDSSTAVIDSPKGLLPGFQGWYYSQPLEASGQTGGTWQLLS